MYSRVCNSQNVLMQILKMRSLLEGKQDIFFIKNKNLNTINKEFNVRNNKTELSTMQRLTVKYRQFSRKLYCFLISSVSIECFFYFLGEGYSVNIRHMAAMRIKKKHIWIPVLRRSVRLRDQASLMQEPEEMINAGEKDMISMRTTITALPLSENIFVILLGISLIAMRIEVFITNRLNNSSFYELLKRKLELICILPYQTWLFFLVGRCSVILPLWNWK